MNAIRRGRVARRLRHILAVLRVYRNPAVRFFDYLGLVKAGRLRVTLRNGLRFWVRSGTGDFGILDEIFGHGVYDRALSALKPGQVVVDVGAHVGAFALAAATRGAIVNCFEPLRDNFDLLNANAKLNGCENNITTWRLAVTAQAGSMEILTLAGDTGGSTFFPAIHPEWSQSGAVVPLPVSCTTLHAILTRQVQGACDCLKLDCEGSEFEILQQAEPEDLRRIGIIILEYHPVTSVHLIRTRLEQLGFVVDIRENPCILFGFRTDQTRAGTAV